MPSMNLSNRRQGPEAVPLGESFKCRLQRCLATVLADSLTSFQSLLFVPNSHTHTHFFTNFLYNTQEKLFPSLWTERVIFCIVKPF